MKKKKPKKKKPATKMILRFFDARCDRTVPDDEDDKRSKDKR